MILGCVFITNTYIWDIRKLADCNQFLRSSLFQCLWNFKINQLCPRALLSTQLLTLTPVPHSNKHKKDPGENLLKLNLKSHVKMENQVHLKTPKYIVKVILDLVECFGLQTWLRSSAGRGKLSPCSRGSPCQQSQDFLTGPSFCSDRAPLQCTVHFPEDRRSKETLLRY